MIKLREILNESKFWVREFGDPLPTFNDVMKKHQTNESGILYKAGVKKYGKEGMAKILSAAGKKKSHAEIGAIKDKYEKDKKESVELGEGFNIRKIRSKLEYEYDWDYVEQEGRDRVRFDWDRNTDSMWVNDDGSIDGHVPRDSGLKRQMKKLGIKGYPYGKR